MQQPETMYEVRTILSDKNKTEYFEPEIKPRSQIIAEIEKVKKDFGYTSNCCFNLDGSIEIHLEKPTLYFGIRTLKGKAIKLQ